MKIINDTIIITSLISFPILIYVIYNCYRELKCEKYNKIIFNISLLTSLYLCLKYGETNKSIQVLLFCNIPILISYLKNQPKEAIILSIITLLYSKYIYNTKIIINIIKFISYFIIYIIGKKKKIKEGTFIISTTIIQSFLISIEYILIYKSNDILIFLKLLLLLLIFCTIIIILLYLFNLGDNISSLYLTVSKYEKEKQLKNSLFKITHEVKNPIAVCKGYLEMIDINDKNKLNKYIPIIKQEIDRSLNIMTDFMEFSKIKIEKEIIDINVLLEDIENELNIIINKNNIKFIIKITQEETFITGDYNRLKQVFINIIKNSIESITTKGKIEIVTHILKDKYYIEIIDNGCGMDEYTLKKAKEMFFTTKTKGSGLGISLSNEIIKAHNGSIKYISKKDKGTKVIVKLPITVI